MSEPVELLLSRLTDPRANGKDRWRAACPNCGAGNRSTLSVGIGDSGCVLVKCWKSECSPDQIAAAVGLTLEDLFPPREGSARPLQRRRLITAGQALEVLEQDVTLTFLCASDMARGIALDEATRAQLMDAAARMVQIRDEVAA